MRDIPGTKSADVLTAGDIYDLPNRLARDLGQLPQDISQEAAGKVHGWHVNKRLLSNKR